MRPLFNILTLLLIGASVPGFAHAQGIGRHATLQPSGVPINRAVRNSPAQAGYYAVPVFERDRNGTLVCVNNCPRNAVTRTNDTDISDPNQQR